MTAKDLISSTIMPLIATDTGRESLNIMSFYHLRHLPIVSNRELIGVISEDDILANDVEAPISIYPLTLLRPCVEEDAHIYEVMQVMAENKLTVIPVVSADHLYQGLITQDDLLMQFANMASFTDPGSVIVLELGQRSYSLGEIARIVESENASILSTYITSSPDSSLMEVTLKINRQDIQHIVASLERFGYKVKGAYTESDYYDSLKERYDSFLTYLNV